MKIIKLGIILAFVISLFSIAPAMAEWVTKKEPFGTGWIVTNGKKNVKAKDERSAKKKAKLLNKNASEFKTESTGPCADPDPGIRC